MRTRVFIVDDHAMVRRGLAAMIGFETDMELCGEADDFAPAMSGVALICPEVVVVDISLRGSNGIELIKNIKTLDPRIHFVVLSVHDETVYALRALKAGAMGYVMKRDIATKVIEAIRKVRTGQLYISEQVSSQMLNRLVKGQDNGGDSVIGDLSDRELEVVTLIGSGQETRQVATRLHMSIKTVETHRAHIKEKIGVSTATELLQFCVRWVEDINRVKV